MDRSMKYPNKISSKARLRDQTDSQRIYKQSDQKNYITFYLNP